MEFNKGYEFSIRAPNWIDPITINKTSIIQGWHQIFTAVFVTTLLIYYALYLFRDPKKPQPKLNILKPLSYLYLVSFLIVSSSFLWVFCGNVIADIRNLSGLSLSEKRSQLVLNQYYPFLEWCKKRIPPGSKIAFSVHDYYYNIWGRYALFPSYDYVRSSSLYRIVFHPKELPVGEPLAVYRPAEYIIKEKVKKGEEDKGGE